MLKTLQSVVKGRVKAEQQETGSFDRNKFISVKSYKMNIVQK